MSDTPREAPSSETPRIAPGALSALLQEIAFAPASSEHLDLPSFRTGDVVGRLELVREIGRGGFGVVWEARDRELGRPVAFKALRAGGRPKADSERLLREGEAAARLSHPNIVTLHDAGRFEGRPYLVMELLRGETLAVRLEREPTPPPEALRIAIEVAKGLAHAHAKGVVHRDLTPGNVFLCEDGQVKVLDFGMALALGRPKLEGGTPAFMAPEQWRGAPEDERTDVFALGVLLYRMLANELPFPRGGAPVGAAPHLRIAWAPALAALVARMLRRDPVERPRDAGIVLSTLLACLPRLGPEAPAPVNAPRRRPGRANGARSAARRSPRHSIAVLPFVNMSADPDQEYFSGGLAEEILNALAQVDGLQVAGRSSSFAFRGSAQDLREIGQKLGVRTVLEGSVRRSGARVRISAQLVNVADGFHLWSRTFDRELTDIFAVQDEIARAVVSALKMKLMPGKGSAAGRATSAEAFRHFLLGRQHFGLDTLDGFHRASAEFRRALEIDPGYAPALGWQGVTIYALSVLESTDTAEKHRVALEAAERAVALAPDLPELHSLRGWVRTELAWDWAGAKEDLERALALAPGDAPTRIRYAHLLAALGRPAHAIPLALEVTDIDPLSTDAWRELSAFYLATDQPALAETSLLRALAFAPTHAHLLRELGFAYLLQGRPADALGLFERHAVEWIRLTGAALAQHDLGRADASSESLELLAARHAATSSYQVAQVHAWRGELDLSFEWLGRSHEIRDPGLHQIKYDPLLRNIRGDPRYTDLLRTMKLPLD